MNEKIRPTISITATNGSGQLDNGSATNDTVITVSFNISEPTSNFIIDDISISQGTISNFTSTSNISYQAKIRPLSNNFILIDVAENSFTDTASNGNITAQQFKWKYDGVSPTVDSVSLAADNSSIVVAFTEPVFSTANGTGNLEASDFALSISGGTATLASATPTAITQNGNTYTLSFNLSGTPDGSEVISVAPLANSIFDATGNQAATSQSNGSGTLNDQTKPTVSAITFAADNSYIDVSFSVDVYANSNGSGALEMNDFTLSFAQNQGTATAAQIIGIKKTDSPLISSASALQGGESVVRLFISFNGTPNGLEAITIAPKDGSSIFDAAGNGAIVNQTKNSASFKDQVLPVVTINPANSSTNILRNANIIISFSEKIRNIDNSEINDVNVDSLIVLNRQNNPENSLAFDASIDTDKKVITVDPLVDFDYSETIYLSIGGFEDFGGNILTSNPSTMFNVIANVKPVAIAQDVTLNEDSKISIELKGTDSENAPLSYVFSLPRFGELAGDAPNLVYSPMADFFGPDSFRFVVNDGFDNSDSSFIKINVQPINDSPKLQLANLDTLKINQVSNEGYLFPKNNNQNSMEILSISDVDNDKIAKTIIKIEPFISGEDTLFIENGNIYPDIKSDGSGKVFTFTTPDLIGANHAYSLSLIKYKNLLGKDLTKGTRTILGFVSDGDSLSNSLSRIINLNIVNSIPEALSESYHTLEDSAITLSLKASDKDSDLLTFNIIQDPLNGKLRGELPDVMYIPNDNFYGKDSIKYNVNDGIQNSKTALVFIHVKSLNDPPTNLSFQSPDDESEIVITINNLEGSQANFKWHQSTDPDDDKLQYLFNSWYEIIDQNGKLNTESIDSVLYNTEYSIPYKRFLSYLDKHRSPRGKFIWNVNVTDGKDTTYSNIRFTLNIEGKYIALSVQDDIIPKSYSLKQNYPNPFNPITRIQFDIPSRSKVSINIYDILGSKVTTLINQDIEPGRHVITWNAVDSNNRKLPSGLYFYQIHADSFIATKKMILVK